MPKETTGHNFGLMLIMDKFKLKVDLSALMETTPYKLLNNIGTMPHSIGNQIF